MNPNKDQPVRIGFVGVGNMGQAAHLRNYVNIPDCEVAAICELRRDLADKVAARFGIPHVYETPEEMLANERLDGIVASQPFERHGQLLPALLKAGIPVFTEKPLASTIQTGEEILRALADSGTWHMIGYHKRCDPATLAAKAEIDRLKSSGELGALTYVRHLMPAGDWIAEGFTGLIQSSQDASALKLERDPPAPDMDAATFQHYTTFVNYYIHQVNLMRHLLGESYQVTHTDPRGVLMICESRSGIPCTLEMSPFTTSLDWQESVLVCFEHGWVKLELPAPLAVNRPGRVVFFRDAENARDPRFIEPQLPWIHAMRQQAIQFVKAIRGESKAPCEAAEALEDLVVARDYIRLRFGQ